MTKTLAQLRINLLVAGLSLAAVPLTMMPAASAASYDGAWSVLIVTNSGSCDRAYRYPVRTDHGAVLNDGPSLVTVSGKVGGDGAVSVLVSGGGKVARGSGRLGGKSGKGSWRGGDCAGTWQAEKRSS